MATWNELHKTFKIDEPHEAFVQFAKEYLKPGMRVLDLGCGRGRHTLYCARRGIEVHAVDIAESGLDSLREACGKERLSGLVKVSKADIKALPFPDAYFDAIISVNVLNHGYRRDIEAYFREATRVLKKRGVFFMIVVPPEFIEEARTAGTVEVEKGTFLGIDMPDGDVPHHAISEHEAEELLAGYDILKMEKSKERSRWKDCIVTRTQIIARKR